MQETDNGGVYPELLSMEDFLREEKMRLEQEFERNIILDFFKKWPPKSALDPFRKTRRYIEEMNLHRVESEYYQALCNEKSREAAAAYNNYRVRRMNEIRTGQLMSGALSGILEFFERNPLEEVSAEHRAEIVEIIEGKIASDLSSKRIQIRKRIDQGRGESAYITTKLDAACLEEFLAGFDSDWSGAGMNETWINKSFGTEELWDIIPDCIVETNPDLKKLKDTCGKKLWHKVLSGARKKIFEGVARNTPDAIFREVNSIFDEARLLDLLEQNERYRGIVREYRLKKEAELRMEVKLLSEIPERYIDFYPAARRMKRRFFLHIGPTNSGKTHDAIRALCESETGVYLAPLRLLAYEQFDSMNRNGFCCSLRTGEERIEIPGAGFVSSTIEMADFQEEYDTAVIDEAQMIGDLSRGGAWTAAILGLQAKNIHVCASPTAETILAGMVRECGDELEVIRHERQTPLKMESWPALFPRDTLTGDAFIVFRRANVHAVAAELQKKGYRVSIIYGALPYDVRHEEARKFNVGETDVVVATDAIGMGLNMPVRRIVFLESVKYDGKELRPLLPEEVKQIAGRAGRYGLYDAGYVTGVRETMHHIRTNMFIRSPEVTQAVISFPEQLIGIEGKVSEILKKWNEMAASDGYMKADCTREIQLAEKLEEVGEEDKRIVYSFASIPFDEKSSRLYNIWRALYDLWKEGRDLRFPGYGVSEVYEVSSYTTEDLAKLEEDHKVCDLLYFYAERFGHEEQANRIMLVKQSISKCIMRILSRQKIKGRRCKCCGGWISWNSPFDTCRRCFTGEGNGRGRRKSS